MLDPNEMLKVKCEIECGNYAGAEARFRQELYRESTDSSAYDIPTELLPLYVLSMMLSQL